MFGIAFAATESAMSSVRILLAWMMLPPMEVTKLIELDETRTIADSADSMRKKLPWMFLPPMDSAKLVKTS